jgi:plastocyanin
MDLATVSTAPATDGATTTTTWLRLARGAAVALVLWSIALQTLAGTVIPPVAVIGAAYLVFAVFSRGLRRRLGLAIAVFSVLAVAGNLPAIVDELRHPESAPAFILTLLAVTAAAVALVAGLGAFRQWSTGNVRRLAVGSASVFVLGAGVSTIAAANTSSDGVLAFDVVVTAEGLAWHPLDVRLDSASSGVWVDNRDGVRHTFTVPQLGIDFEIPALKSRRLDLETAAPGTYPLICAVPGHESMVGTLIVEG